MTQGNRFCFYHVLYILASVAIVTAWLMPISIASVLLCVLALAVAVIGFLLDILTTTLRQNGELLEWKEEALHELVRMKKYYEECRKAESQRPREVSGT